MLRFPPCVLCFSTLSLASVSFYSWHSCVEDTVGPSEGRKLCRAAAIERCWLQLTIFQVLYLHRNSNKKIDIGSGTHSFFKSSFVFLLHSFVYSSVSSSESLVFCCASMSSACLSFDIFTLFFLFSFFVFFVFFPFFLAKKPLFTISSSITWILSKS